MEKLYVNSALRFEREKEKQKAIVNYINGMIEIAFFEPVATNQELIVGPKFASEWAKKMYPSAKRALLPSVETMILANSEEKQPLFKDCCSSTQEYDIDGRVCGFDCLDEKGHCVGAFSTGIIKNIYAAIRISVDDFLKTNPGFTLDLYKFKNKDFYDLFSG
ncbi:MAG: hypothetical protein IKO06_01105 [Alphaproteobacteria bacterium]|nr:hypothetical protein [Alphaproteobacteria bacterium]